MSLEFFLESSNIPGASAAQFARDAFAITAFDFSASAPVASGLGGLGVGRPTFDPLQVSFASETGLNAFLSYVNTGGSAGGFSLVGFDVGLKVEEVYRINLAHVIVTGVDQTPDGYSVSLAYEQIGVESHDLTSTGVPGPAHQFSFDIPADTTTNFPPNANPPSAAAAVNAEHYYLLLPGIDGGSTDAHHLGWFEINAYEVSAIEAALTGGAGAGAGKVGYAPISLELQGPSGVTHLLESLLHGTAFSGARIEGVSGGMTPQVVYDLDLVNAGISQVEQSDSGHTDLSLTFTGYELTMHGVGANGQVGAAQTTSWNLLTNSSGGFSLPSLSPATTGAAATPDHYALEVSGILGDSHIKGELGAFNITGFSFGFDNHTVPGGLPGKAVPSELQISFANETGLTGFLTKLTTGTALSGVSLVGTDSVSGVPEETYRVNLAGVHVTDVSESSGGGYSVSLEYAQIGVTTHDISSTGQTDQIQTFGYDFAQQQDAASPADVVSTSAAGTVAPTSYYLLIDGVDGGSTDPGHVGWFKLSAFDLQQLAEISQVSGGGSHAGKPIAAPLELGLSGSPGLTQLLADLAAGKPIAGARIEGMTDGLPGTKPTAVYDLDLSHVIVNQVSQTADGYNLSLDYGEMSLKTTGLAPNGVTGEAQTATWSFITNSPSVTLAPISPSTTATGAPAPTGFFLESHAIAGDSTAHGYQGAIQVEAVNFGMHLSSSLGSAGAGVGVAAADDVEIVIGDDTGLSQFLHALSNGQDLGALSVVGTNTTGVGDLLETYRLNLQDARVVDVKETATGGYTVSLAYQAVGVVTHPIDANGSPGPAASFGWNAALGTTVPAPPNAAPGPLAGGVHPQTFYLLVDGVNGGCTDPGHVGWFKVEDFSFDDSASSTGAVKLGDVTVALGQSAGLTDLLAKLASGGHYAGVRIEGISGGSHPTVVYDLTLANAVVTQVADSNGSASVGFAYGSYQLSTTPLGPSGQVGTPQTTSWNVNGSSSFSMPHIAPAGGATPPPAPTGLALDASADTGVQGDDITSAHQLVIDGSASAGATVTLYEGSAIVGTATADSTGAFHVTTSALAGGAHVLTATATDSSGLTSTASAALSVTVDSAPPTAPTGLSLDPSTDTGVAGDHITSDTQVQIDGDAEAGSTVTLYDGATVVGTAVADGNGAFQILTNPLGGGTHNLTATARDAAGNVGPASAGLSLTVDALAFPADTGPHNLAERPDVTGASSPDAVSATLAFTDGDLSSQHTVAASAPVIAWSAGGALPAGLTDVLANALTTTVSDSTGTGSGAVTAAFSAADANFDFLAEGETLTITYTLTLSDGHGDAVSEPVTFVVTGANDAPVLSADAGPHAITELAGVTGSAAADTASTTLAFTDPDLNDLHHVNVAAPTIAWSGGAVPAGLADTLAHALSTTLTDSTGAGSGSVSAAFTAPDSAFDFLAQGETLTIAYPVTVTDSHGATSTQSVEIVVTGTNDAPVLSADAGPHAIAELAGVTGSAAADTASTKLAFTDPDLNDHHHVDVAAPTLVWSGGAAPAGLADILAHALTTTLTDSTGAGTGSLTADFAAPDSTFDFLAQGETLTITYPVTVTDNNGATSTRSVEIVVTGTNDAPTIAPGAAVEGIVQERPDVTSSTAIDQLSGAFTMHDPDLNDRPTVSLTGQAVVAHTASGATFQLSAAQVTAFEAALQFTTSGGSNDVAVDWTYAVQDQALDFLGVGESVTVTSSFLADDHHGGTTTETVKVTLNGANDLPIPTADVAGLQKNTSIAVDAAHGVLSNDTDPDIHDVLHVSAVNGSAANVGQAIVGTYGSLTLNADGSYSYHAANGALPNGSFGQDIFTYTSSDGHGGQVRETLAVTVYGSGTSYIQGTPGTALVSGGNGKEVLDAGVGEHTLVGGNGADALIAGWGADTMTGGRGPDVFVFGHHGFGASEITDFTSHVDTIQFDHRLFANFADVMSHAAQVGANVVITLDAQDSVTLAHVSLTGLSSQDFLFT